MNHSDELRLNEEVQRAAYFRLNAHKSIKKDTNYDWVLAHAQAAYSMIEAVHFKLEDKANEILKLLGGGSAIVTVGTLININVNNRFIAFLMVPALIAAACAMYWALRARNPCEAAYPPWPSQAFEYAGHYGEDTDAAKGAFVGRWEEACAIQKSANEIKADMIDKAAKWMVRAIFLLLLPFVYAVICPPVAAGSQQVVPAATAPVTK